MGPKRFFIVYRTRWGEGALLVGGAVIEPFKNQHINTQFQKRKGILENDPCQNADKRRIRAHNSCSFTGADVSQRLTVRIVGADPEQGERQDSLKDWNGSMPAAAIIIPEYSHRFAGNSLDFLWRVVCFFLKKIQSIALIPDWGWDWDLESGI